MKVSLVVASGAHQGKVVPIMGPQFLIGRDPECQLRPASQAVSKQHCALIIRGDRLYLKDFGSTNGTLLNDAIVKGEERQIQNNDSVKVGPLDFTVRIEAGTRAGDGTPLPELNPAVDVAIAAVKAAAAASTPAPKGRSADQTPAPPTKAPKQPVSSGSGPKEVPALTAQQVEQAEQEHAAAMLLGIDEDDVPGGTTVVDVPTIDKGEGSETVAEEGAKPGQKKPEAKEENSSSAASDLLRKYMRRPR